ncbi:MAG TPA: DUF3566 domain-containing protein [Streptosporangiaceae bacterium]|nr:DUF3566 domain-containing protein [Streptosporangiaceae bacterium]
MAPTKKPRPGQAGRQGSAINTGRAPGAKVRAAAPSRPAGSAAQQAPRPGTVQRRDAQLVLARIEPWSVMKFTFMISLVAWVAIFVATALIYFVLSSLGVFHSIEQTIGLVTTSKGSPGSNASGWFSASTILGYTMLAGAVNVLLFTALATVGAAIYNVVTRLSGGIEVTLQEAD